MSDIVKAARKFLVVCIERTLCADCRGYMEDGCSSCAEYKEARLALESALKADDKKETA